jgi:hypothetical protein
LQLLLVGVSLLAYHPLKLFYCQEIN